jgi:hypothetical protein
VVGTFCTRMYMIILHCRDLRCTDESIIEILIAPPNPSLVDLLLAISLNDWYTPVRYSRLNHRYSLIDRITPDGARDVSNTVIDCTSDEKLACITLKTLASLTGVGRIAESFEYRYSTHRDWEWSEIIMS